jgi:signal transduction histidine kinase
MDAEKEKSLYETLDLLMEISFGEKLSVKLIDDIVHPNVSGYGTTFDEKALNAQDLIWMITNQRNQSQGIDLSWSRVPFSKFISDDGNTAVLGEDIAISIQHDSDKIHLDLRFSIVLVYQSNKWVVVHWHGSKPDSAQSEVDTFGIEDWKQKNAELERLVAEKTADLNSKLEELKATQAQLIQSEKMASLGELTAGIAHEIQNPLNFVNNFSEITQELLEELEEDISKKEEEKDLELQNELITDIKSNLGKINHHGKRADGIVKSMLQHSRVTANIKEPTDINALADEYLRLAYHGLRAKDKSFNSKLETSFDESIGKINIVSQDIGRVILNLLTNAFYAVNDKKILLSKASDEGNGDLLATTYEPTVSLITQKLGDTVVISVKDNGMGIPKHVIEKVFQPFFTTKPTGQGTGLGLSMSYDIITKGNNGQLLAETKDGEETTFTIILPIK